MRLINEICSVTITIDEAFTVNSSDNRYYDIILNPENYRKNDFYKTLSIHIDLFYKELCIALTGSLFSYDTDCALLNGEILTVLQDNCITQLNVTDGSVTKHISLPDTFGTNFAIYEVSDKYIIYGEIEITCLDRNFTKEWSFSGRDIWASVSGKKPFEICCDRIKLYDFMDNYYEIGFDGKLIADIPKI